MNTSLFSAATLSFSLLLPMSFVIAEQNSPYASFHIQKKVCSRCNQQVSITAAPHKYCPYCGAYWAGERFVEMRGLSGGSSVKSPLKAIADPEPPVGPACQNPVDLPPADEL